ncbi:MAG: hypothetical protein CEN88_456 [Candidatus Berkelbacteria bacterium Licking1014_2]|uniref:NYN domain-containing protein n=1 Tax=Candidatus Berkelbacteria bacterium Licking1014_2 TaxID=2017146 RepID=A0A554LRQ7_9BACT|nr:MAG: hypothetical protein CEN88_456 [Candidatus Berkelbacteria bacterium Licking1014_2]
MPKKLPNAKVYSKSVTPPKAEHKAEQKYQGRLPAESAGQPVNFYIDGANMFYAQQKMGWFMEIEYKKHPVRKPGISYTFLLYNNSK